MSPLIIGSFPYKPGFNPYQSLITGAIEQAGLEVVRIPPEKWFPLQRAFATNCDILHLDWPHDWYGGKNAATRFLKRWMYLRALRQKKKLIGKTKLVWTAHNLIAHDSQDKQDEHCMIQSLINQCDGIMVMSQASHDQLREQYQVPNTTLIKNVYHGHYADCYPNLCDRTAAREKLKLSDDKNVIVTVGSVRPYKGLEGLIDTLLKFPISNLKWIIAGRSANKEYGNHVTDLVASANRQGCDIEFHNALIPDNDLQYYFNAADACILPFENILNSGSMLMAMSFGCPVIAPAVGSIPEIVNRDWGFLYTANAPDSTHAAIEEAMTKISTHSFDAIRDAVISQTKEKYSWDLAGERLCKWYHELCD